MRTIRALAAAAALAGLLASSGPAAAKIMQLTLSGPPDSPVVDKTNYMGVCDDPGQACGFINQLNIDFVFTYDTSIGSPSGYGPKFLSALMEIRLPDDQASFIPDGQLLGSFVMPLSPNVATTDEFGYYNIFSDIDSGQGFDIINITFPDNGANAFDQNMTYYPDPYSSLGGPDYPDYGNSQYDLNFYKVTGPDEHPVVIYNIFTIIDGDGGGAGGVSTRYVNFKDITPSSAPEPATWALMLLGLGGLGGALRGRRAAEASAA